jgi:hypothetical protein
VEEPPSDQRWCHAAACSRSGACDRIEQNGREQRKQRGDGGRQPLEVDGCGREIGLDLHVREAAPHRPGQAVAGLGLSMHAFHAPAMAIVEGLVLLAPSLVPVPIRRFRHDAKHDRVRGPRGRVLTPGRLGPKGCTFASSVKDCRNCDLAQLCLSPGRPNKVVVIVNDYPALLRAWHGRADGLRTRGNKGLRPPSLQRAIDLGVGGVGIGSGCGPMHAGYRLGSCKSGHKLTAFVSLALVTSTSTMTPALAQTAVCLWVGSRRRVRALSKGSASEGHSRSALPTTGRRIMATCRKAQRSIG